MEVQPERDPNFLQAADGHLIVVQTRQSDRGNYTCVAENVANTRMSPAARLQVVGRLRVRRRSRLAVSIMDCLGTSSILILMNVKYFPNIISARLVSRNTGRLAVAYLGWVGLSFDCSYLLPKWIGGTFQILVNLSKLPEPPQSPCNVAARAECP